MSTEPEISEEFEHLPSPRTKSGPFVQLAVFCEDAFSAADRPLSVIKILDDIDLDDAGLRLKFIWFAFAYLPGPPGDPPIVVYTEGVRSQVVMKIYGDDAEGASVIGPIDLEARPGLGETRRAASVFLIPVWLDQLEPGLHWWIVATDQRVLSKTALNVRASAPRSERMGNKEA